METKIGLSDMVTALRRELEDAQKKSEQERLRFTVEDIELELQIIAENTDKASLGIKFWVLNSSLEAAEKNVTTQALRLKLKVSDTSGDQDNPKTPVEIKGVVSD